MQLFVARKRRSPSFLSVIAQIAYLSRYITSTDGVSPPRHCVGDGISLHCFKKIRPTGWRGGGGGLNGGVVGASVSKALVSVPFAQFVPIIQRGAD